MSVCAYVCVCLRKKDVSDPCGPVYLYACVGVEGGQKQGCLYPSPFPWLLCHRHSGHRRMKRLWIFSPPPYTHQSRKIRQKMSPFKAALSPTLEASDLSSLVHGAQVHTRHAFEHAHMHKSTRERFLGLLFRFRAWSHGVWVLNADIVACVH